MTFPGNRITSLEEANNILDEAAKNRFESEANFIKQINSFWLDLSPSSLDPWSDDYRQYWINIYQKISGKYYTVDNEIMTLM